MISVRLKYLRKLHKITQYELAIKLNTTKATISNWENGYSTPSNEMLVALVNIFNCSSDYLLRISNESESYYFKSKELNDWYKNLPFEKESNIKLIKDIHNLILNHKHL